MRDMKNTTRIEVLTVMALMLILASCGGRKHSAEYYMAMVDSIRNAEQVKEIQKNAGIYEDPVVAWFDTLHLRTLPIQSAGTDLSLLGGFVSVDQLDEIEGFPQEAKKYFVIQHASPKKLNVNRLSLQELRKHPYINYYMAKTIVDYRRLHGDIKSLEDLRFSKDFPPEVIRRLTPYVEY